MLRSAPTRRRPRRRRAKMRRPRRRRPMRRRAKKRTRGRRRRANGRRANTSRPPIRPLSPSRLPGSVTCVQVFAQRVDHGAHSKLDCSTKIHCIPLWGPCTVAQGSSSNNCSSDAQAGNVPASTSAATAAQQRCQLPHPNLLPPAPFPPHHALPPSSVTLLFVLTCHSQEDPLEGRARFESVARIDSFNHARLSWRVLPILILYRETTKASIWGGTEPTIKYKI
eukprot:3659379-Pleurochrysis_carterae.AAC.1